MIVFIHVNIRFIILEYSKICQANLQKKVKKIVTKFNIFKFLKSIGFSDF